MAHGGMSDEDKYRSEEHRAFVLGYTGGVGRGIVKKLAASKLYKKVVLIGRREIDLGPDVGPEFEQKVVDFEKLEEYEDVFEGLDTGFSALGTTQGKSGSRGFVRIDHDYVLHAAEIAKAKGCKHFNIVSSIYTNKNSSLLYLQTKGQVEEALKVMHFDRLSIYRPGGIIIPREDPRAAEKVALFFLKPVTYFFPTTLTVPLEVFTKAILNNTVAPSDRKIEVLENKDIHKLCGSFKS